MLGVFDVVGPVMHGPSSNHTGGAVRIGYIARQIMGGCPKRIRIGLHPTLVANYTGQRTHAAIIAGLAGRREDELGCMDAMDALKKQGIPWEVFPVEERLSRNTMRVEGSVSALEWSVNADSVGGANIRIDSINGLEVDLDGNGWEVVATARCAGHIKELRAYIENAFAGALERCYEGDSSFGGRILCAVLSSEPAGIDLTAPFTKLIASDELTYRKIPPLGEFSDKRTAEPLFTSFEELLSLCGEKDMADAAMEYEAARSGVSIRQVYMKMAETVDVMRTTFELGAAGGIKLIGGLTDPDDGMKLLRHADESIISPAFSEALGMALIVSGMNASGARIVAAPTGGSAGVLPSVLLTMQKRYGLDDGPLIKAAFVAAAIGIIVCEKVDCSGTTSGCQGEIGISAGMAAGAAAYLAGGDSEAIAHAAAIAIKNLLGLTCDLPASPIEVPCIKRNAIGAIVALAGAEMAVSGVRSAIEPDDAVAALAETAKLLPACLRCTQEHGLAGTKSGERLRGEWKEKLATLK